MISSTTDSVVRLEGLTHHYGKTVAVDCVTLDIPSGKMVGFIGPDGTGKSTILGLISGAIEIQTGRVEVLEGDMADAKHRRSICSRVAYMPQGLGKNVYQTLSVTENIDFFGRLFGQGADTRKAHIEELLESTGLGPFRNRSAGQLSGGMKQKLGICCALIHDPDLLILDEPTTGVDPLSRREFWSLIKDIRARRAGMSVIIASADMEEAEGFDWLVAADAGKVLATGTPQELRGRTGKKTLGEAFIQLLPEEQRRGHRDLVIPPRTKETEIVIEARDLTRTFGNFTAVDHISLTVERGEIFGFLGSNGCGKSTTMKMLTGLLPASSGTALLFGKSVTAGDMETRREVGYMSQAFSLYTELTVRQNLVLHAKLYRVPAPEIEARVVEMVDKFGLQSVLDQLPDGLPLGIRQRLSLAVAVIHRPAMLILDEPTSGVDPIARDDFWEFLVDLSRSDGVTIFISTHFMNEALLCDRISLMDSGKILATDKPATMVEKSGLGTLEETFIAYLEKAQKGGKKPSSSTVPTTQQLSKGAPKRNAMFSLQRLLTYSRRESLELMRDPIRLTLALGGTVFLMIIMGYGISLDVNNLPFTVLDRDHTAASREYTAVLSGSNYFIEKPQAISYQEVDERIRDGELSFAIEIPPNYGGDLLRGKSPTIGLWVDGGSPQRAETIVGYLKGTHATYLYNLAKQHMEEGAFPSYTLQTRFSYNPDVISVIAMIPAVIPLLLLFIPAILTALGVVREKELGSILNLYTTPVTKLEFVLGKQIPYVFLGMINFFLMMALASTLFHVPVHGSFFALTVGAFVYVLCATGIGLLMSTFMGSQIAAIIGTAIITLLPAVQFSGLLNPVSTLSAAGSTIGNLYPTTYFIYISRGAISKGLGFFQLRTSFFVLLSMFPVLTASSAIFLKKQGR